MRWIVPDRVPRPESNPLRDGPVLLLGAGQLLFRAEGFVALCWSWFLSVSAGEEYEIVRMGETDRHRERWLREIEIVVVVGGLQIVGFDTRCGSFFGRV